MSPDQRPSLDAQMAEAARLQGEHIVASHAVDRRGWTRQQWVDDARKQMEDLHGSILDLVNGHVVYLLNEIDYLRHQLDSRAGISDSPAAAAGSQPTTAGETTAPPIDWRDVALKLFRAPNSDRSLLSTTVRDAVEAEVAAEQERKWGVEWERRTDAASGGECA